MNNSSKRSRAATSNLDGLLEIAGNLSSVQAAKQVEASVLVHVDPAKLSASTTPLTVGVYSGGKRIDTLKTVFVGPRK